jgi:hypothetical protein
MLVLLFIAGAAVFAIAASMMFTWASGKSPLWNVFFGAVLALAGAGILLRLILFAMRQFANDL